jgi:hypothetical protein
MTNKERINLWLQSRINKVRNAISPTNYGGFVNQRIVKPAAQVQQNILDFTSGKRNLVGEVDTLANEAQRIKSKPLRQATNLGLGQLRTGALFWQGAKEAGIGGSKIGEGLSYVPKAIKGTLTKDERDYALNQMQKGALQTGIGGLQYLSSNFRMSPFGQTTTLGENTAFESLGKLRTKQNPLDIDFSGSAKDMFISDAIGIRESHPTLSLALDTITNLALGKFEDKLAKGFGKLRFDSPDVAIGSARKELSNLINDTGYKTKKGTFTTRTYNKTGNKMMGLMAGIQPYQDENGKWGVKFNKELAIMGLGVSLGLGSGKIDDNGLKDIADAEGLKTNSLDNQNGRIQQPSDQSQSMTEIVPKKTYPISKQSESSQLYQSKLPTQVQEGLEVNPSKVSSYTNNITQDVKNRGLVESIQESNKITNKTKAKVSGTYSVKTNPELMGEAKALLVDGGTIDFKSVKNIDQKVAATIEQARILDAQGDHKAAANLFNNLSEHATELGRGVQAFNLIDKMSPEAVSLSAAGKIKKYNITAKKPIPELTGTQQKSISDSVESIRKMPDGRNKNIAIYELDNLINSFIPSSKMDKAITVWKAGLLTSLRTHERNLIGNSIMLGSEVSSKPIASAADWVMSKRTGQRTQTSTLKGLNEFGSAKTKQQVSDLVQRGYDPSKDISKFEVKKINWGDNPVEQGLKKYTDGVFRVLSAEDRPFYNAAFKNSLYDQAGALAKNAGKSGDASFIQKLVDKPTEKMLTTAVTDANFATFHDKNAVSGAATAIKRFMGQSEWTKLPAEITMPFTGVPSSIVGKTIAYSPIGLVKGATDMGKVLIKNLPDLQRQAAQEVARGTMGTAIFTLGAYLMSKGLMTGQPKDQKERDQWQLEGKQANSIFINGKWRGINSVGPQTLVLLAGAKYNQEMSSKDGSLGAYAGNLGKDQLSQTFLQGMMGPLNAINDPARYGKNWVGTTVSGVIPNIVKDTSKALDPVARETNSVGDYFKSGIPVVRNTLLPKRDVLGNEIAQEPTGVKAYYDLFNSKTPIKNPIVNELSRLASVGSSATPSEISKNQTFNKVKVVLTPQELNQFESEVRQPLQSALTILINSQRYKGITDEDKAKAIGDTVEKIRKMVKAQTSITPMPDGGFTSSKDAPQTFGEKIGLYGKALVTDPKQTVSAVVSGNPIRKVVSDAVILERQNYLGSLDKGDKSTVVDHIIPLSLGGNNDKSNLQTITAEENALKASYEVSLLKQLQTGEITKATAQKRMANWRYEVGIDQNQKTSDSVKQTVSTAIKAPTTTTQSGISGVYTITNATTGKESTIDLSEPLVKPQTTGYAELDKELLSK